jgi:hypothetical protein
MKSDLNLISVQYHEWKCGILTDRYQDGSIKLQLYHPQEGPIATATVYLPHAAFDKSTHVAIKDYSENEGMLNALINAGVVAPPDIYIPSGHVKIPICKLLLERKEG